MHENLTRLDLVGPALARALGDPGWERLEATLVSGGKSNLTFELTSDAGEAVLRRPPDGPLLPRAHDMGREARVQRALAGTAVPVAEILLEDAGELIGVPFYVMEKVDGYIVGEPARRVGGIGADRCAVGDVLVDTLADLHAMDPGEVGLSGFGRPSGLGERQVRRWSDQWERSKSRDIPAVDELGRRLRADPPTGPGGAIVHGDFRIDNCLLARRMPPAVAAVLDWELSTLGEPLADLGLFLFYWREPTDARPAMTPAPTMLPGFPPRAYLAERYAKRTGADLSDLSSWVALAHFKSAASRRASRRACRPDRWPGRSSATSGARSTGSPPKGLPCSPKGADMDFSLSAAAQDTSNRMWAFMREEVFPAEPEWAAYLREHGEHAYPPVMERLKELARSRGLWNLFLPAVSGLTNLD